MAFKNKRTLQCCHRFLLINKCSGSAVPNFCTLYLRIMCKRRVHYSIKNFGLDIQDYGGYGFTVIVTKKYNIFLLKNKNFNFIKY